MFFQAKTLATNFLLNWGPGTETKTILSSIHAEGNILNTVLQPAYWLRGNDTEENPNSAAEFCPPGQESYNSLDTHPYDFKKIVTVGCFSMENCVEFDVTAELGDVPDLPPYTGWARLTAPSAHLVSEFTGVSYLDPATGHLVSERMVTNGATEDLVIIHTEDEQLAFGMVTQPRPPTSSGAPGVHYQYSDFGKTIHHWD